MKCGKFTKLGFTKLFLNLSKKKDVCMYIPIKMLCNSSSALGAGYCIDLCINIIMCKRVTGCQERIGKECYVAIWLCYVARWLYYINVVKNIGW